MREHRLLAGSRRDNTAERSGATTGPSDIGTWLDDAGDTDPAQLTPTSPWTVATTGGHTAPKVYATGSYPDNVCAGVTSDVMHLGTGPQLTFWSKYSLETGWDKGEVQVSTNGGASWTRVSVNYPASSGYDNDACGLPTTAPTSRAPTTTTPSTLARSLPGATRTSWIRWVLSSDTSQGGSGWWVDDIAITNVEVPSSASPAARRTRAPSPRPLR